MMSIQARWEMIQSRGRFGELEVEGEKNENEQGHKPKRQYSQSSFSVISGEFDKESIDIA